MGNRDRLETTLDASQASVPPGELLLVAGPGHLGTHALAGDALTIGRAPDCDVVIDHRAFSRRHAQLRLRPSLAIQDLGSTNGTRIPAGVLHGGDAVALSSGASFHIGPFSFVVVPGRRDAASVSELGGERLIIDDPTPGGLTRLVREIAASGVSVLILGESGVGKDVLASTLHAASGRTGPLCRINCAALSETLLESELFGHDKGAFTGAIASRAGLIEAAAGGTVFLDEIGELPLAIQAKLLRAVEAREVTRLGSTRTVTIDVRFLAATHRDLPAEVAAGRFRHDLFYRLDGVTLRISPLRERPGAIARLALGFLADAAQRAGREVHATAELIAALETHDWPGNVRELKAVIDRAVLLSSGREIGVRHLAFSPRSEPRPPEPPGLEPRASITPPRVVADAPRASDDAIDLSFLTAEQRDDRERVITALERCVGNQTRAAKLLGLSRTTLVNRIALYRIPRPRA